MHQSLFSRYQPRVWLPFVCLCLLLASLVIAQSGCNERVCRSNAICEGYACGSNLLCVTRCEADNFCDGPNGYVCEKSSGKCICNPKDPNAPCAYRCAKAEDCNSVKAVTALLKSQFPKENAPKASEKGYSCQDPATSSEPQGKPGQCLCQDGEACMTCKAATDCDKIQSLVLKMRKAFPKEEGVKPSAKGYVCQDAETGEKVKDGKSGKCTCPDGAKCQADPGGGGGGGGGGFDTGGGFGDTGGGFGDGGGGFDFGPSPDLGPQPDLGPLPD